jgi:hypothetical protein
VPWAGSPIVWRTIIAHLQRDLSMEPTMGSRRLTFLQFVAAVLASTTAAQARAQMPGTPTLQNAFANPGITAALDVAGLGGASSYALAGAWAPSSARFQLSAGLGMQTRTGVSSRMLYGARVNFPILGATSNFGVSAFAGYGGLSGNMSDTSVTKSVVPIGATASYRLAVGTSHGISSYGSPMYELIGRGGGAKSVSVFRGALGLDVGITRAFGATLGVELGQRASSGSGRPSGTAFGAALSYALGAR